MGKLTFVTGNKAYSSWSLRPWLALKHCGTAFEEIVVPLYVPGYKEKLLAHSVAGKVPVLKHDAHVIWDSLAICEYLAEQFPESRLWPDNPLARAEARSVSAEMHSGFPVIRQAMPFNCRATGRHVPRTAELETEIARVQMIWRSCRERYGQHGPWLFGDFSIADAMYIPVTLRFVTYGVALDAIGRNYLETVQAHAPVRDWIASAKQETAVIESSEVGRVA
ncbi:MAG TPA: glutathione S-transferase family protein [Gammaproteobacteria bacterium]|nr:glutathione S-transferase family protein [Gammaproteobacteria bacterium]